MSPPFSLMMLKCAEFYGIIKYQISVAVEYNQ